MSDANTKSGPVCHCITEGDESEFISYDASGQTYHKIVVGGFMAPSGQHLLLPNATGNVVHIFNKWPTGTAKIWSSDLDYPQPGIKDGDELKVQYYNASAEYQGWYVFYNKENIASGQLPTKL